jgi:phosphoglycolate phosphatase
MKDVSQPWEVINPNHRRAPWGAVVFDFDGTLSLLREGWSRIMAQLGLDLMAEQNLKPAEANLAELIEEQMLLLSGKPSIFQMRKLGELIEHYGGKAGDPEAYLQEFLKRLYATSEERKNRLKAQTDLPQVWAVPGAHQLLETLQKQGIPVYLASGTDLVYVQEEAQLLDLTRFFGEEIHAPANNTPNFTKRTVIERILSRHNLRGEELLGFGDGYSETVEVKRVGGVAVGLATVEPGQTGIHALKRKMLIELGADLIIPHYGDAQTLLSWLSGH